MEFFIPMQKREAKVFVRNLIDWYQENYRDLPWRRTKDPYKIWVSEIILQQTRVVQGMEYYKRFIETFPTVLDLANAEEDTVLRLWQGLGYYSRARNLHKASKQIAEEHEGVFPKEYKDIRALAGVGEYTAGAISAFAYNKAYPAVDGNVLRFLSRISASSIPIDTLKGKRFLSDIAMELLSFAPANQLNQALIEIGALICLPKNPHCSDCPVTNFCAVYNTPNIENYPVKEKKIAIRKRYLYFLVIRGEKKNRWLIQKRDDKDIWKGLYQFPLIDSPKMLKKEFLQEELYKLDNRWELTPKQKAAFSIKHRLSHQELLISFLEILPKEVNNISGEYIWIDESQLESFAFPVPILHYFKSKGINLT